MHPASSVFKRVPFCKHVKDVFKDTLNLFDEVQMVKYTYDFE